MRLVLACLATLLVTGCTDSGWDPAAETVEPTPPFAPATTAPTPPWEESRIEREIRTGLLEGAKVATVAQCQEPERWSSGDTFPCDVIFSDQFGTERIRVRMKPDRTYGWSIRMAG